MWKTYRVLLLMLLCLKIAEFKKDELEAIVKGLEQVRVDRAKSLCFQYRRRRHSYGYRKAFK